MRYGLLALQTFGWFVLFLLVLALGLVSTSGGMQLLGYQVNRYTSQLPNPVTLSHLGGTLWQGPRLQGLTVADANGIWLTLSNVHIRWHPTALFTGQPFVTQVAVRQGTLYRLPQSSKKPSTNTRTQPINFRAWLPYLPTNLHVGTFTVEPPLTGHRHVFTARIAHTGSPWHYTLDARSQEGVSTTLEGTLNLNPTSPAANLRFHEAPGGLVGTLARVPPAAPLNLVLNASTHNGLTTLHQGDLTIGDTSLRSTGHFHQATHQVSATLALHVPTLKPWSSLIGQPLQGHINASASGTWQNGHLQGDVTLHTLRVAYQSLNLALKQPANLNLREETLHLSPVNLSLAGGTLTARGLLSPQNVDAHLNFTNLKPQQLQPESPFQGTLNGTLTLTGTPQSPHLSLTTTAKGDIANTPLTAHIRGNWQNASLSFNATGSTHNIPLTANATLQAQLSLLPFHTTLGASTPVQGRMQGQLNMAMLNPYLWASRQTIGGMANLNATVGGTLSNPQATGTLNLSQGSYTHAETGICLTDISANIQGRTDHLVLQSLTATTPGGGSLSGSGRLDLTGNKPLKAQLTLTHLHMFCGGMLTGQASGHLEATGTLLRNRLAGTLAIGPLNVQIPGNDGMVDIPQVTTVRAGSSNTATASPLVTRLAITLNAPNQIFVRGRGLDAEFGGNLTIGGTTGQPHINGSLQTIRGAFALFGRTLKLDTTTSIRFNGPVPPSPYLNVHATTEVQDHTLGFAVTGPAQQPAIAITATPALPQDEAMAMLLFGKRMESISPFQALQLAQALRTLRGEGDAGGTLIDTARQRLGLDTLTIGSDTENNPTLTTGKYLTDDVYLSITQAAVPEDREVKAEIELTPAVSGYSQVNGLGVQTFGVLWKRDY